MFAIYHFLKSAIQPGKRWQLGIITLLLYAPAWKAASASPPEPEMPPGYILLDSGVGAWLYRRDVPGGNPDFVQLIDLSQGGALKLMHSPITQQRPGKGVYGGDDPRMASQMLEIYWDQVSTQSEYVFCIVTGSFFYMPEYPTRLPFPLKVDGAMVTEGWGIDTYVGEHAMLELWAARADIREQNKETLYGSTAPDILGALTENANKSAKRAVARTFAGVDDRDGDGAFETVLIFSTRTATQKEAAATLRSLGAEKVIMLDGGGSTQLLCRSGSHIQSERPLPQVIAVLAGAPPPVSSRIIRKPLAQILVEGEHFPLEIEVQNTGEVNWLPGETRLALASSALGGGERLDFLEEIAPGETAVLSATLAAFSHAGVYSVEQDWSISYDGVAYPGQSITLTAVVIPPDLADQREELDRLVGAWDNEKPEEFESQVMGWIETKSALNRQFPKPGDLSPPALAAVNIKDILWVPLLMLPVIILVALAIGRAKRQ